MVVQIDRAAPLEDRVNILSVADILQGIAVQNHQIGNLTLFKSSHIFTPIQELGWKSRCRDDRLLGRKDFLMDQQFQLVVETDPRRNRTLGVGSSQYLPARLDKLAVEKDEIFISFLEDLFPALIVTSAGIKRKTCAATCRANSSVRHR